MNEDRVKDPLGDYEAMREKTRPDTTWTGLKLFILVPLILAALAGGLWGVATALRALFGG